MIVSDYGHHKINFDMADNGYLEITAFHKKDGNWLTKTIRLSPVVQDKLVQFIQTKPEPQPRSDLQFTQTEKE